MPYSTAGAGLVLILVAGTTIYQYVLIRRLQEQLRAARGSNGNTGPGVRDTTGHLRRFQRYYFDTSAKMTYMAEREKHPAFGRVTDICEGGVGLVLAVPVAVGNEVEVEIGSARGVKLQANGVVRHRRGVHHGVEFSPLSTAVAAEIRRLCVGAIPIADVIHAEELV